MCLFAEKLIKVLLVHGQEAPVHVGQLEVEVEVGGLHLWRVPPDVVAGGQEASLNGLADERVLGL